MDREGREREGSEAERIKEIRKEGRREGKGIGKIGKD